MHSFRLFSKLLTVYCFSAFNEVADQPPTLKMPRGVTLNTETRRPGATKNLLLLDKLQGSKVNIQLTFSNIKIVS